METLLGRCGAEHPKSAYSQQCLPSITAMIQPFFRGRCWENTGGSIRKTFSAMPPQSTGDFVEETNMMQNHDNGTIAAATTKNKV